MKEVVYGFEEFKAKVDSSKPIHHQAVRKALDSHGLIHKLTFKVYGVAKDGHLIVFECSELLDSLDIPKEFCKTHNAYKDLQIYAKHVYEKLVEKYAKPLGSTEGRWEL